LTRSTVTSRCWNPPRQCSRTDSVAIEYFYPLQIFLARVSTSCTLTRTHSHQPSRWLQDPNQGWEHCYPASRIFSCDLIRVQIVASLQHINATTETRARFRLTGAEQAACHGTSSVEVPILVLLRTPALTCRSFAQEQGRLS